MHFYAVEWAPSRISWHDFRSRVVGSFGTASVTTSLRGLLLKNWEALGLARAPVGDHGVHASASPFEGMVERFIWLDRDVNSDPFGRALLRAGLDEQRLIEWVKNPKVISSKSGFEIDHSLKVEVEGVQKSLFVVLEDKNAQECVVTCIQIAGLPLPARQTRAKRGSKVRAGSSKANA